MTGWQVIHEFLLRPGSTACWVVSFHTANLRPIERGGGSPRWRCATSTAGTRGRYACQRPAWRGGGQHRPRRRQLRAWPVRGRIRIVAGADDYRPGRHGQPRQGARLRARGGQPGGDARYGVPAGRDGAPAPAARPRPDARNRRHPDGRPQPAASRPIDLQYATQRVTPCGAAPACRSRNPLAGAARAAGRGDSPAAVAPLLTFRLQRVARRAQRRPCARRRLSPLAELLARPVPGTRNGLARCLTATGVAREPLSPPEIRARAKRRKPGVLPVATPAVGAEARNYVGRAAS